MDEHDQPDSPEGPLPADRAVAIHPDLIILSRYVSDTGELRVIDANPATERILGLSRDELIGRPLRTLLVDEAPFASQQQREAFNLQLRERRLVEFPGLAQVRDQHGKRRGLRIRICWPAGEEHALVVGEDVTERSALEEHSGAAERLRSAAEVSGLLSHHVNNALASAMLNVDLGQGLLDGRDERVHAALEAATEAMRTAAQALTALAATAGTDAETRESCELGEALRTASANLSGAGFDLQLDGQPPPHHVWGALPQVEMILGGLLPLLQGEQQRTLRAHVRREANQVVLKLESDSESRLWLSALLDPSEPQPTSDTRSVRLFASVQVLRAIGGELGLPTWSEHSMQIELRLRAAPGAVTAPPRKRPVLLVSGDGALRALVGTQLTDRDLRYTQSIREGLVWLMRPRGGVVLCDADELEVPLDRLLATNRMVGGDRRRLILLSRKAPSEQPRASRIPQVTLPLQDGELVRLIDGATVNEEPA